MNAKVLLTMISIIRKGKQHTEKVRLAYILSIKVMSPVRMPCCTIGFA